MFVAGVFSALVFSIQVNPIFQPSDEKEKKVEHSMKNPEKTVVVTKQNSGEEISVNTGDVIQLELEGTGATGYWWYSDNLDGEHLRLISEETQENSQQGRVGTPVTGIWKFKALKAGQTNIKMDYYRVWEDKESAIDHFDIKLQIK